MNILLVQPRFLDYEVTYPLGLAHVGAVLTRAGHRVVGLDLAFASLSELEALLSRERPGWVGVSVIFGAHEAAHGLLAWLKSRAVAPIVVGGPYATTCFEELLSEGLADVCVLGEGERTAVDLTRALEGGRPLDGVPGLAFRDGAGSVRRTDPRPPIDDLDRLPFPDRRLFPLLRYHAMLTRRSRHAAVVTSRGCPHHCAYCPVDRLWGPWRGRSPENVIAEIHQLATRRGIREFHVEDSNFLADRARALAITRLLARERLGVVWQIANGVRPGDVDEDLLGALAEGGCYRIEFGIETLNPDVAAAIGRPIEVPHLRRIIRAARSVGIETGGYFILGLPGETAESARDTVQGAVDLGLDLAAFSLFRPVPGSRFHETLTRKSGGKSRDSIGDRPGHTPGSSPGMPSPDFRALARTAARRFYLRPAAVPFALRYLRYLPQALQALARYRVAGKTADAGGTPSPRPART